MDDFCENCDDRRARVTIDVVEIRAFASGQPATETTREVYWCRECIARNFQGKGTITQHFDWIRGNEQGKGTRELTIPTAKQGSFPCQQPKAQKDRDEEYWNQMVAMRDACAELLVLCHGALQHLDRCPLGSGTLAADIRATIARHTNHDADEGRPRDEKGIA